MPMLSASHLTPFPSDQQPPVTPLKLTFPQKCEKGSDEAFTPPDATIAAQRFHHSTSTHTSDTMERGSLKDDVKAVEVDEQGTDVAAKGGKDTLGPCAFPRSFADATPQLFVSSVPTPRSHLRPSPVHLPPSPPFKRQPLGFYSTCPPSDNCQPCQDEQLLPGELPRPIEVDDTGDTSLSYLVFSSPVKSSFFTSKRGNWQPQPV